MLPQICAALAHATMRTRALAKRQTARRNAREQTARRRIGAARRYRRQPSAVRHVSAPAVPQLRHSRRRLPLYSASAKAGRRNRDEALMRRQQRGTPLNVPAQSVLAKTRPPFACATMLMRRQPQRCRHVGKDAPPQQPRAVRRRRASAARDITMRCARNHAQR